MHSTNQLSMSPDRLSRVVSLLVGLLALCSFLFFLPGTVLGASTATVNGDVVNLRASPGTACAIVGKALRGQSLEVLGKQGDWYQVRKDGVTCWIAGWLVEVNQSAPQVSTSPSYRPSPAQSQGDMLEVTGNSVNIRSGPGTTYAVAGRANRGDKYRLLGKSGDWYKIEVNGGSAWITGQYTSISPGAVSRGPLTDTGGSADWAVINGTNVNIRSGPGTNYSVVSTASRGDRFLLADRSADWYKVFLNGGGTGWVVSWLVEVDQEREQLSENGGIMPPKLPVPAGPQPSEPANPPADGDTGDDGQGGVAPSTAPAPPAEEGRTEIAAPRLASLSCRLEGKNTVITVQSDGAPIKYRVATLNEPDRLVIDIEGFEPGSLPESMSLSSPLAGAVRVGWFSKNPNVTRIVVDLKVGIRYGKQLTTGGDQLKITLEPRQSRSIKGVVVVLDPGHGGSDPGAIGPSGLKEKDVNLDIARKAAQYLTNMGAKVVLTRNSDTAVDLYERPKVSDRNGADLFISIHSNANPSRSVSGTSTYYLRTADESQDQARQEGMHLAGNLQRNLVSTLGRVDKNVLQANYVVLTHSKVPAALVEVAFLSNHEEEALLGNEAFRDRAGQAIARGIADYLACK